MPTILMDAQIPGLPDNAFYIPGFLTEDEEGLILNKVYPAIHLVELSGC